MGSHTTERRDRTQGPIGEGEGTGGSGRGPWYLARAKALSVGLSNAYFKSLGLSTFDRWLLAQPTRTAVYGPVRTVVWQGPAGDRRPCADVTGKPAVIRRERRRRLAA
jgi:hypothetical protein